VPQTERSKLSPSFLVCSSNLTCSFPKPKAWFVDLHIFLATSPTAFKEEQVKRASRKMKPNPMVPPADSMVIILHPALHTPRSCVLTKTQGRYCGKRDRPPCPSRGRENVGPAIGPHWQSSHRRTRLTRSNAVSTTSYPENHLCPKSSPPTPEVLISSHQPRQAPSRQSHGSH